ncbi:sulfite dehydrogenase [Mucilaginibacter auburnensis]|uniref:Sulfane dehydrogenase subunit SoxC n=1 Tax=Mucilaginibacter auburnensis TaxID=1457233 RepID=A0A2H9VV11_9SPHI|nr:sulfite dehydrogenase [Mucilaginibacter auburnensis]PJJ84664.1 sulfane dehydrogenase subunit SoxC [Mucilaginibacter auburnensis]
MEKHKKQTSHKINRRTLLGIIAGAVALPINKAVAHNAGTESVGITDDPTKSPGAGPSAVGKRSAFEQPVRKPSDISSRTPLQDTYGTITPSDLHYERHHAGVPVIDPAKHQMLIHGLVNKPMKFTVSDLKKFPAVSRICFIECAGNFRGGKEDLTPQDVLGLTSQSEWTGVLLSTLLRETGVDAKAKWFLAEGSDAAVMTRTIPIAKAWDDAMIVYAQNGEAIRPEQGYPIRLLLPGFEGNMNIKWLRRIEISDEPYMTREDTSKYTYPVKDKIRMFSFEMDARSIITYPSYPQQVNSGWIEIRGIAWSGRGKVDKVEVSTDGGKTWELANLQEPVLSKAHTYFRYLWNWNGAATEILSRVTDETGYIQPTLKQLAEARGPDMGGYHMNPITAWQIKPDGKVLFKPEIIK